ncbi:MAG: GNAT family N-acetyltransferase [Saprospiraceae bacterium]
MEIIKANTIHLKELTKLFDGYRVFYKQESDTKAAEKFLKERLENDESIILMAFDDKGKGVGFTQLYPTFSSVSMQRFYILNDLFVLPTLRGQGIGESLLNAAKALAKANKWKGLALETATDNPAQKLYERLGWERSDDFYHYFWSC